MTSKYGFLFGLLLIFLTGQNDTVIAQPATFELSAEGEAIAVLEEGFDYMGFSANSDYLAWYDLTLKAIYVYDLKTDDLQLIELREGRGPGEFAQILDLKLYGDKVYFLDFGNNKVVEIDIKSHKKKDIPLRGGQYIQMAVDGQHIYLLDLLSPDDIIVAYDIESEKKTHFDFINDDNIGELKGSFQRMGLFAQINNRLMLVLKQSPNIFVFDSDQYTFQSKLIMDVTEAKRELVTDREDGGKMIRIPEPDIVLNGALTHSEKPGSLFILAEGKSKKRTYNKNILYEFDLATEEFINEYPMQFDADEGTMNDRYVFTYSAEDYTLYRYPIKVNN